MTARLAAFDAGMGVSFIVSAIVHLAVFLLLFWWGVLFPARFTVQETYYVDVVNLPVASPQAGSPTQKGNDAVAPEPPPVPENRMTVPQKAETKPKAASTKAPAKGQPAEPDDFAKKMAKLEGKVEAGQQEATLERLRKKTAAGTGKAGMPAGTGSETGSDYTAFIQSRLKDAFRETIAYSSKNPEMVVRIFIDTDGKLARRKIERGTGDRAFEIAVTRAIELASEKFTPPPARKMYEGVFVFRPQGITQNKN